MKEKKKAQAVRIKNKKAYFDYHIAEEYTAGIVLTGTEIKSIREGKASLVDTYCFIHKEELWVKQMYIAEYFFGSYNNHSVRRDRKLLLHKKEIRNLQHSLKQKGFTIIPLFLFINQEGRAKLKIGLAKGKKEYDKRQTLLEKMDKREMDRARKQAKW